MKSSCLVQTKQFDKTVEKALFSDNNIFEPIFDELKTL